VPVDTPATIPVAVLTVATAVLLLTHDTPVPVALLSVVVPPGHTLIVPVIDAGKGLTVTTFVLKQPRPVV
jgi:hypothetical protein